MDVGFILSSLLILSFYAFPMSYAENWAFGDPKRARKQPKTDSSLSQRLPQSMRKMPRVTAGLAAGGCLMVVVVVLGAIGFALYYHFSGQPEEISQVIPTFVYWFPFALLGMVADIPFQIIYWEDTRLRVLLRLVIWWFPRVVIIAFVINPPILRDLESAATALTVLAIDGVLAAYCAGLYAAREQLLMNGARA